MTIGKPELLAAYWTIAGDVFPGAPSEVSPFTFEERAAAASSAGYTGMGLVHQDLVHTARRIGYAGIRRILADNGIRHVEVEFLNEWYAEPSSAARIESDRVRADLLEAAGELNARSLKICARLFDEQPPDIALMREEFSRLCEQARGVGSNVIIEMMPFTSLATIDKTMAVIAGADQPNGGILLDVWHVHRGGMDYSEIAKIPARFLKGVELDDADPEVVGTLFEDTRFKRRLCGDGVFDVPAFLHAIHSAGFDAPYYGVEIISETFRKQPLDVMARSSYDTTMRQVELARV